jgi:hypothetical protein
MSGLYDQLFVIYILQMFNEGTVSGPADISVLNFSPHVVKQVEGNWSHCISHPPSKFRQCVSQWWHVHSILDVLPKEKKSGGETSGEPGGQLIGQLLPISFFGNLVLKDVRHFLVKMWRRSVLMEQHVIWTLFFQNRHEEFLQHIWVLYASHSTFRKEKTPETFCLDKAQNTFNFELSLVCSVTS